MPKAIRIYEHGGPDVLRWEDIQLDEPEKGEVCLQLAAAGLNFIDCYHRSGLYPMDLPLTLGAEGVGVIKTLGAGVNKFSVGQRVAYSGGEIGSYAEERIISASALIPVPDSVDDHTVAAMMLKGLTVHMLLYKCFPVSEGDIVLVQAAAGGVGSILCQWANYLGATVIGTVGNDEKAEKAKANGCHHTINYTTDSFPDRVKEITNGKGVPVVYDSTVAGAANSSAVAQISGETVNNVNTPSSSTITWSSGTTASVPTLSAAAKSFYAARGVSVT